MMIRQNRSFRGGVARSAFTVMEMLLVIVVISVLVVLLYPSFKTAIKQSREAKCVSNLKTTGSLLAACIADRGHYPGLFVSLVPGTSGADLRWFQLLQGYATGGKPPTSLEVPEWLRCPLRKPATGVATLGYGYNYEGFGHMPDDGLGTWGEKGKEYMAKYWKLRPSQVQEPGKKLVIGDSLDDGVGESWRVIYIYRGANNKYHAQRHRGDENYLYADGERRHGGGNYLYADGHVGWLHVEDLWKQAKEKKPDPFFPF